MKPIPISAARSIADDFGYDQVIIIARKVGTAPDPHGEHVTTYGVDATHCGVAARAGRALQRFMGWPDAPVAATDRAIALVRRIADRETWQSHLGQPWEVEAAEIVAAIEAGE